MIKKIENLTKNILHFIKKEREIDFNLIVKSAVKKQNNFKAHYIYIRICVYTHTYVCINVCIYVYIHICSGN